MTNEKAYKFNGFEEWLVAYKKDLPEILKKDVFVSSGACRNAMGQFNTVDMVKEGMDSDDVVDYIRLNRGWLVGAYDGALFGYANVLLDGEFVLLDNPTYTENLKALRFYVFLDQEYQKNNNINKGNGRQL